MTTFTAKLDRLCETIGLASELDVAGLAAALDAGQHRVAWAIGSGGSAATAEYFATCRGSLQAAPTLVATPMQFILGGEDLSMGEVWIFSARGENPDVMAALEATAGRRASAMHVVTSNASSSLADAARAAGAQLHVMPVADPKDSFLATHSLVAAVTALLRASDLCCGDPIGAALTEPYVAAAERRLSRATRPEFAERLRTVCQGDTLLLLADPRLGPAATVIDTSCWEAALLPVQRTDFRNFAHGRHVWLTRRADAAFVLALTGTKTQEIWSEIRDLLPTATRWDAFDYANCGRFQNALAVLDSLCLVEALGTVLGIDPGKPGAGEYARGMYGARGLEKLVARLSPAVRHKRAAAARRDDPGSAHIDLAAAAAEMRARFEAASFRGLVLDYDGTIVTTEGRFDPPDPELINELLRLLDEGLEVALATGRGGSAGEMLREILPPQHQARILVGYYNGAYLRSLDIDIREEPAPRAPEIARATAWLEERQGLFHRFKPKESAAQISINLADVRDPSALQAAFDHAGFKGLRSIRSRHSLDICLADACKTRVVGALADRLESADAPILCIGDSGGRRGNDHVLLGTAYGISVDQVCDRANVGWSLFGDTVTGPKALTLILKALLPDGRGGFKLDLEFLELNPK